MHIKLTSAFGSPIVHAIEETTAIYPTMNSDYETSANLIKKSFKRLFETLMEQTPDRVYIKDTESRFIFVSEALARAHGLSNHSEIEGMTDFDFYDKETAQRFYDVEQEIIRTKTPLINCIEKEHWKDGSTTWVSHSKAPLRLDTGEAIGIIGISRDVTQEQLFREQLKEQNETMLADYASAEKVQHVMIPGYIPEPDDMELAYLWKPMAAVGGDIINFPRNSTGHLLFFIGDVCGHGVQAAFYTVLLKYMTAQIAESYDGNPKHFLDSVNEQIVYRMEQGFVTAMAGHFEPNASTGRTTLHVANAGHPHILIQRAANKLTELIKLPSALVMGLPAGQASEPTELELSRGDRLLICTDGILEASTPEGEEFGLERLRLLFESARDLPLQSLPDHIYQAVLEFSGKQAQQDDISLIAFQAVH